MDSPIVIFIFQTACALFGTVSLLYALKRSWAITDSQNMEITDLKSKLLLSGNTQSAKLSESEVGIHDKVKQLSSLKKEQHILNEKIIQLEVECEIEQVTSGESKLLTEPS